MHIIRVYPNRNIHCNLCGKIDGRYLTKKQALHCAQLHAKENSPAIVINHTKCSEKCCKESEYRNIHISVHDKDCPQKEEVTNG